MKKVLGSLLILCLSLFGQSEYRWNIDLEEKDLYLHQSTVLTMECKFSKEGKNDDVEFTPPQDIPFTFELLSQKRHFEGELQTLTYKYLVFAKKSGNYKISLKPTMIFTTQSAIDNVIVGRDNVNDLEVEREDVKLKPLLVKVTDTASMFTGSLNLQTDLDTQEVSAYEPVHLEIAIKGEGNLQELSALSFEIEGVDVFADKMEQNLELSTKGYKGVWLQRFAFVGKKDFVIPALSFHYFDLDEKVDKVLKTEAFAIKVKTNGIKREELIDKVNVPSTKIDLSAYIHYLYYLLTFISGFITAKLIRLPKRRTNKEKGEKIKAAKSEKALLEVLMMSDKDLFSVEIEALEEAVYKAQKISLSDMKKRILSKL